MLLTEYDEQAHIESEREIALREGEKIGREIEKIVIIRKKYIKHISSKEVANMLELPIEYVQQVMSILSENPDVGDSEIAEMLTK